MGQLGFAGIVFITTCVAPVLAMRRLQAAARSAQVEAIASRRVRLAERLHKMLGEYQGTTVVLITSYEVADEAAGHALRDALANRWSDRVEVVQDADSPSHPCWSVVTTTETVLITPLMERQWLSHMRLVCDTYDCKVRSYGVLADDSPPTGVPNVALV